MIYQHSGGLPLSTVEYMAPLFKVRIAKKF